MRKKSKQHSLRLFFRRFSCLIDKTGGWWGFVVSIILLTGILLASILTTFNNTPATPTNKKQHHRAVIARRDSVRSINKSEDTNIICSHDADVITVSEEGPVIMDVVETMPEFPGGEKALMEFIAKHINPSLINKDKKISKIVYYRIAISKDGTIMQTELLRGCGDEYNKDALRVIQLMPRWIPGVQDHQKVNVYCTLPINYNQKKHEKK